MVKMKMVTRLHLSSFAVAMEVMVVMVVMVMVGTAISLKMGCAEPEEDTLFSLRVPMIIWRISLLASPRTASSAWMWSSLREVGRRRNKQNKHHGINLLGPSRKAKHQWDGCFLMGLRTLHSACCACKWIASEQQCRSQGCFKSLATFLVVNL